MKIDRRKIRNIVLTSVALAVALCAALLNFFGEAADDAVFVSNFLASVLYVLVLTGFLSYAAIGKERILLTAGRCWCLFSMAVFLFSAVATAAELTVEGPFAVVLHVIVLLFAMPMYGLYLLIGSTVVLNCVSFCVMLFLSFVPEIVVTIIRSVRLKKELKK